MTGSLIGTRPVMLTTIEVVYCVLSDFNEYDNGREKNGSDDGDGDDDDK